jgi:Predicted membrane protein (DUF2232)
MINFITVGLLSGLASALLFAVVITGSPLGIVLSYVAPLPVLIGALGWNHRSGLVATAGGGLALALVFRPEAGLAFAIGSALPAWWLAYLGLLGRPGSNGSLEWYPVGRLLLWIAASAATVTFVGVLALGSWDYDIYRQVLRSTIESVIRMQLRTPGETPLPPTFGGVPREQFLEALVGAVPFLAATAFALVLTLNLWIAAKVVAISQRLPRPWPAITATRMPASALLLLAAAVLVSFVPGFAGAFAIAFAGGLLMAFALQGLALLHDVSRGKPGRTGLLVGAYILLAFIAHTFLPLLALAGIADTAVDLRRRFPRGAPPPTT